MLDVQGAFPAIRLIAKNKRATSRNNAVLKYRVDGSLSSGRSPGAPLNDKDVTVEQLLTMLAKYEKGEMKSYLRSETPL